MRRHKANRSSTPRADVYREMLEYTKDALLARASRFRMSLLTIGAVVLVTLVWSAAAHAIAPLSALTLLPPLLALAYWLDARFVARWRRDLLERWRDGDLDLDILRVALRANVVLPRRTLDGMLEGLPSVSGKLEATERGRLADAVEATDAMKRDQALATGLSRSIALAAVVIGATWGSWRPLVALTLAPLPLLILRLKHRAAVDGRTALGPPA
jgi:hypothetical protein